VSDGEFPVPGEVGEQFPGRHDCLKTSADWITRVARAPQWGNAELPLKSRGGSTGKLLPVIIEGLRSRVQALPLNKAQQRSRNSELKQAKPRSSLQ
jgi:hypothetical protein